MINADIGVFCLRVMLVGMIDMIQVDEFGELVSFEWGSYLNGDVYIGSMIYAGTGELVPACDDCLVCTDVY